LKKSKNTLFLGIDLFWIDGRKEDCKTVKGLIEIIGDIIGIVIRSTDRKTKDDNDQSDKD